jgi:hypothetical protein
MMDNHYHLLAETLESNLSAAMQWLNLSYSVWFNRRHRPVGGNCLLLVQAIGQLLVLPPPLQTLQAI